jgi:hypothetical protein
MYSFLLLKKNWEKKHGGDKSTFSIFIITILEPTMTFRCCVGNSSRFHWQPIFIDKISRREILMKKSSWYGLIATPVVCVFFFFHVLSIASRLSIFNFSIFGSNICVFTFLHMPKNAKFISENRVYFFFHSLLIHFSYFFTQVFGSVFFYRTFSDSEWV